MRTRLYTPWLITRLRDNPAAVLVGPRQCGKTTLAQALPRTAYFDLENPGDRVRLEVQ
jgi:predicted AAA+ superfamily ATPase